MIIEPKMTLPNGDVLVDGDWGRTTSSTSTRPADEMDITRLCKPFGMLHNDTQVALHAWPHGVECFQDDCFQDWWKHPETDVPSLAFTYRAKPAPVTIRATIPWEFLKADIRWVAMDKSGAWLGYGDNVGGAVWRGHTVYNLEAFVFPQGNEHWENAIHYRPLI